MGSPPTRTSTATTSPALSLTHKKYQLSVTEAVGTRETCGLWCARVTTGSGMTPMMFKHVDTGAYLGASGQTFGRPINGQMEIVGSTRADGSTKWRTQEGVYVHQSDFDPKRNIASHDEL